MRAARNRNMTFSQFNDNCGIIEGIPEQYWLIAFDNLEPPEQFQVELAKAMRNSLLAGIYNASGRMKDWLTPADFEPQQPQSGEEIMNRLDAILRVNKAT